MCVRFCQGSFMKATRERLIHGCLPRASIDFFWRLYPLTDVGFTAAACAMYFFITASLDASEGSNLNVKLFCMSQVFILKWLQSCPKNYLRPNKNFFTASIPCCNPSGKFFFKLLVFLTDFIAAMSKIYYLQI